MAGTKIVSLKEMICPKCGYRRIFAPDKWRCDICKTIYEKGEVKAVEIKEDV